MRPQRRATCTHKYTSSTSADSTCHPMSRNGIPTSRGCRITYSIGRAAIPLGSRPASTQPMSMAATGMAIRMRNRLSHGT